MSIKSIFVLILLSVFILYGIIDSAIQQFIILPSFLKIEHYEAEKNLERSVSAIKREIRYLDYLCHNWAAWDDTYHFTENLSKEYIESNLGISTYIDNSLNLIYIYNTDRQMIWGKTYDLDLETEIHLAAFSPKGLSERHSLIPHQSNQTLLSELTISGIFITKQGPMIISARPILTSNNEGPIRGTLLIGKFFNQHLITTLVEQTQVNFQIIHHQEESLSNTFKKILNQATTKSFYQAEGLNKNYGFIYTIFPDIDKKVAFLILLKMPQEITQKGLTNIHYTFLFIFISNLLILIITLLVLKQTIYSPLQQTLANHVSLLSNPNSENSHSFSTNYQDNVDLLTQYLDNMLEKIENRTVELEEELEKVNEELTQDIIHRKQIEQELHKTNEELQRLVSLDSLTNIANRRRFDEHFDQEWKRSRREKKPITLIMCDVDFFKLYNDTYGHQLGDKCLRVIAKAISKQIKRPSDLVARYGGEEFAVILPNTKAEGAVKVAEAIRLELEHLKIAHLSSPNKIVTLSLGVSSLPTRPPFSQKILLTLADKALYEAKKRGRNRTVLKTEKELAEMIKARKIAKSK